MQSKFCKIWEPGINYALHPLWEPYGFILFLPFLSPLFIPLFLLSFSSLSTDLSYTVLVIQTHRAAHPKLVDPNFMFLTSKVAASN